MACSCSVVYGLRNYGIWMVIFSLCSGGRKIQILEQATREDFSERKRTKETKGNQSISEGEKGINQAVRDANSIWPWSGRTSFPRRTLFPVSNSSLFPLPIQQQQRTPYFTRPQPTIKRNPPRRHSGTQKPHPLPRRLARSLLLLKEEDAVLLVQVTKVHGAQNWAAISEALPGRNPKSCRLRWCQHLNPIVDTASAFTPQEDDKILAYYHKYPKKWATIAGFLPGRTDNAIKNRWHSVLGKVYEQQLLQLQQAAAADRRLPIKTLLLFPLRPGDVKAFGRDRMIPPGVDLSGMCLVDLSGECLELFPLEAGDLVRGNNVSDAEAMDVDYSAHESLVELRLRR